MGTPIGSKGHTSPLTGTEKIPLSPDGYATAQEVADLGTGGGGYPITFDDGTTTYNLYIPGPSVLYAEVEDDVTHAASQWQGIAATNAALSSINTDDGAGHFGAVAVSSTGASSEVTMAADGHTYFRAQGADGSVQFNDSGGGIHLQQTGGISIPDDLPTSDPGVFGQVWDNGDGVLRRSHG